MKKILFSLVALVASMSMNAQTIEIYKGETLVATYNAKKADRVVFKEAQPEPTTGTAKATINGSEVDVNWVQLWEDGPKFADRNAGMMKYADATSSNFIWGSNWCTPSKEDMSELFNAVSENETDRNNAKVTCEYVQEAGVYGFRFTGKEDNYTGNSLFFPTKEGSSDSGYGYGGYLSSEFIPDSFFGDRCIYLNMTWSQGNWYGSWERSAVNVNFLVRPVLKEN